MKRVLGSLAALLLCPWPQVNAAYQAYPVKSRRMIIDDGVTRYETHRDRMGFAVQILSDREGVKPETSKNGRPFVTAENGENYSVRIYNPLPVRVAVNLSVDGLNSISGKPRGINDGEKWMIEPYGTIVIRGWQVNGEESRRFFFTDKPKSYAQWRGDRLGKDLSANCGVIGVAYFWSQDELNRYYEDHPIYRYTQRYSERIPMSLSGAGNNPAAQAVADELKKSPKETRQEAGTGMGERESNPTRLVEFHYDTGMYSARDAVLIYYDFASPVPVPNPFPALSYAPEMP